MQVAETAEVYSNKVLPYMQSLPASRITWVYNILEKKVRAAGYTLHMLDVLNARSCSFGSRTAQAI